MVEAAISIAAAQPIEYSAFGTVLRRDGNRGPLAAPQNLYLSGGTDEFGRVDAWVAVAVATDEQWAALAGALGHPAWAEDPELSTAEGRRARHDDIDEHLGAWCATRTPDEIVESLWEAGVPVAKVLQPHRQAELPQLQARGFFEVTEHPVGPPARQSTIPMRLSDGPARFHRSPAPLLGQHNLEILLEHDRTQDLLAGEGKKLASEASRTFAGAKNLPNLLATWISSRQLHEHELTVTHNDGQEIVEVVGHAGSQLTDRFHFVRLTELILQLFHLGNVNHHIGGANDFPRRTAENLGVFQDIDF